MKKEGTTVRFSWAIIVSSFIVKMLGLILKIPLSHILGDLGMGYYNTAYILYGFAFLICASGLPKGLSILISKATDEDGEKIYKTCKISVGLLGVFLSFFLCLFASPLSKLVGNNAAVYTITAISPSLFFVAQNGLMKGYFNGKNDLLTVSCADITEGICKLFFGIIFAKIAIFKDFPLSAVAAFSLLGVTFGTVISFIYLTAKKRKRNGGNTASFAVSPAEKRKIKKEITGLSVPITVSAAVMSLSGLLDLLLVMRALINNGYSQVSATSQFGNYSTLVVPFLNAAIAFAGALSVSSVPVISYFLRRKDNNCLQNEINKAFQRLFLLIVPYSLGLSFFGKYGLSLLFPEESVKAAAPLLFVAGFSVVFSGGFFLLATVTELLKNAVTPLVIVVLGCAVKGLVTLILISEFKMGILGAVYATLISWSFCAIALFFFIRFRYKIKIRILRALGLPLLLSMPTMLFYHFAFTKFCDVPTALTAGILFFGVLLYFGLYILFIPKRQNNIEIN